MVKKKKNTKNTISVFSKQIPSGLFITTLVVVGLLGVLGYKIYFVLQDQQKFVQMEETITELTSRIDAKFGLMTDGLEKYCYKASRKLGPEPNICVIKATINISDDEFDSVGKYIENQKDIVGRVSQPFGSYLIIPLNRNYSCTFENNSKTNYELWCSSYAERVHFGFTER